MNRIGSIQLFAEIKRRDDCVTYRGVDTESGQIVLVKVFQPANVPDEAALARFHQEATIYASLDHPNVVKLVKFGIAENHPYLALEFVEGQNLRTLLSQRSPLPNDIALCITLSMLAGLEEIHRHGIIHRDLKPENILIGHDCAVKICDFDLALAIGSRQPATDHWLAGSPGYFSPETILGEALTPRSDLFALGIMLYEMFTGTRPFMAATPSGEINAIVRLPHLAPSKFNNTIPAEIEELIDRLLAKSASGRPESAAAILIQLKEKFPISEAAQKAQTLQRFLDNPGNYKGASLPRPSSTSIIAAARRPNYFWRIAAVIVIAVSAAVLGYQKLSTQMAGKNDDHLTIAGELPKKEKTILSRTDSLLSVLHRITLFDSSSPRPEGLKIEDLKKPASSRSPSAVEEKPALPNPAFRKIFVRNVPWAYLFVGGDSIGQPPRSEPLMLKAGAYQFVFKNPQFPPIPFKVVIDSSTADTLFFSLWERVAQLEIKVYPWAEIYLDGVRRESSAASPIIYLLPGEHRLKFVHPQGVKNEAIFLRAGETRRLEVNMFQQAIKK